MSWGIKITVLYLAFVTLILTLVFTCFGHKTELEYKDYYARELRFQDQLDASNNALSLSAPLSHEVSGEAITLSFPKEIGTTAAGTIEFLRPSNASLDQSFPLTIDSEGRQVISTGTFEKGAYKMRLSFEQDGKSYYKEAVINIRK